MKKPKKIKEAFFLWYHQEYDFLFELNRKSSSEMALMKAMNYFHNVIIIGIIEVKYK